MKFRPIKIILRHALKKRISQALFFILNKKSIWNFVNLCSGDLNIPGYCNIDLAENADLILDLSKEKLPFGNSSLEVVVCISGLNYFTYEEGNRIIQQTYRILKSGGVARFAVQDLKKISQRYLERDEEFFFQKLKDGRDRFVGATISDKFVSFFYGYPTIGGMCKYFYDFESLEYLFREAGFSIVESKDYRSSRLAQIELIDNRPEQMFYLEAIK